MNKKAQGLPINSIILAVIALIVIVVLVVIYSSKISSSNKQVGVQVAKTDCSQIINSAQYDGINNCWKFNTVDTSCLSTSATSPEIDAAIFCSDYFDYAGKTLCVGESEKIRIIC
jgi:hypothetical protein